MQPPSAGCRHGAVSGAIPSRGAALPTSLAALPLLLAERPWAAAKTAATGRREGKALGAGRATRRKEPGWPDDAVEQRHLPRGPLPSTLLKSEKQGQTVRTLWSPASQLNQRQVGTALKNSAHFWGLETVSRPVLVGTYDGGLCPRLAVSKTVRHARARAGREQLANLRLVFPPEAVQTPRRALPLTTKAAPVTLKILPV